MSNDKGRWIYGETAEGVEGYFCSTCGMHIPWWREVQDIDFIEEYNVCPKCGLSMWEETKEWIHEETIAKILEIIDGYAQDGKVLDYNDKKYDIPEIIKVIKDDLNGAIMGMQEEAE